MKKLILVGLIVALLTAVVMPHAVYAGEDGKEKVSRLTEEEITYFHSLDKAYAAAFGYISEMESLVVAWAGSTAVEVTGDLIAYQGKFSALSATFRKPPPASMAGLSAVNNAVADNLDNCLAPCLGIVTEEAGHRLVDWAKKSVGITPGKKDSPNTKSRMFTCVAGQLGKLKQALSGAQGALWTRIEEIEQERFEKELGSMALEEELFGEGDWCFIATAAYGTPAAEEIDVLRQFRDEFLLHNPPGKAFVAIYYETSPPIAEFISEHEVVRTVVRESFVDPVVAVVEWTQGWWAE